MRLEHEELAAGAASIAAPVFERKGWKYGSGDGHEPTEGELALAVVRLLGHVEEGAESATTGRFYVTIDDDGDICVYLQLGCILGGEVDVS